MNNLPSGTITFLITDIEGSTKLWQQHEDTMQTALDLHNETLHSIIQAHGGHAFKHTGDGMFSAFTSALDALRAAAAAQRALQEAAWPETTGALRVRMALHTGNIEPRDGDYFGPPANRVARLLGTGHGGQILLSRATQELVRDQLPDGVKLLDLGQHRLKDLYRPEQIFQVNAPGLPTEFPALVTLDAQNTNLPAQATPFIGREREVAAVTTLLRRDDVRLVTLTGPGGIGKTRLSLQAAADVLDDYEHGAFFVELAPVTNPERVPTAIANTLGLKESSDMPLMETLQSYLGEKHMLLVIDNFEHVVSAAPIVGELLMAAPRLKVLTSSREILRVYGEHDYAVPPLGLPEKSHRQQTVAVVSQYEAVSLFIQRAKAARADFEITEDNAPAIAEICVRLDGLPLAIELAAARVRLFAPDALLERLDDRLKTLTGGARDLPKRQQTLRGAIEWSYDLLNEGERLLFARLAAFQGGRSLEAIEAVCGPDLPIDTLDGTESLMDKSLLRQIEGPNGEPRFIMLETIYDFAREKLSESDEVQTIQLRHAEFFAQIAEQSGEEYRGPRAAYWTEVLTAEKENLHLAMDWSLATQHLETAARLVGGLADYWHYQGYHAESKRWIDRILPLKDDIPLDAKTKMLVSIGMLIINIMPMEKVADLLNEAYQLARNGNDERLEAWASMFRTGPMIGKTGQYEEAIALTEAALAILIQIDDKPGMAQAYNFIGELARNVDDFDRARAAYEDCLEASKAAGEAIRVNFTLTNLSYLEIRTGNPAVALTYLREGLLTALKQNYSFGMTSMGAIGGAIAALGHPADGARLIGAAFALLDSIGSVFQHSDVSEVEQSISTTRAAMGDEAFERYYAEGFAMPLEEAIQLALREDWTDET